MPGQWCGVISGIDPAAWNTFWTVMGEGFALVADLWTGNWDRHSKQWRWARLPGSDRWRPIAEDPDQVFANYEGLLLSLARGQFPKLVAFESLYSMDGDIAPLPVMADIAKAHNAWLMVAWRRWTRFSMIMLGR